MNWYLPLKLRSGSGCTASPTSESNDSAPSFATDSQRPLADPLPSSDRSSWLSSRTSPARSVFSRALAGEADPLGQIRYGFALIGLMFIISLPILAFVDMEQGRNDAEKYQREAMAENVEEGEE